VYVLTQTIAYTKSYHHSD